MVKFSLCPHSSVDRALPSGGKDPRSSRGGGIRHNINLFEEYIDTLPGVRNIEMAILEQPFDGSRGKKYQNEALRER